MFKLSNLVILLAVAVSLALSAFLWVNGYQNAGLFTATFVPAILALGTCFKVSMLVLRSRHS